MKDYNKIEKAYKEVFDVLEKNKDLVKIEASQLFCIRDNHLLGIKLSNLLGFENEIYVSDSRYQRIGNLFNFIHYVKWGENMRISWSDDGRQPEIGEELIEYSFSTGPYVLGGHYDTATFQEFFQELKKFEPKYTDTKNCSLYFTLENGAKLFKVFKDLYQKYKDLSHERNIENKRQELLKQLEELQ